MSDEAQRWTIGCSREARDTLNPINHFMEVHYAETIKQCEKELFRLGAGDPTVFGNLIPHPAVGKALQDAIDSGEYLGYNHSSGMEKAREAVAQHLSKYSEKNKLSYDDVFMTAGAHVAIEICIRVLVNPGQCILLSRPCYTIYNCFANAIGARVCYYDLLPDKQWKVDLHHLEEQLRNVKNIATIIINNPSNPCGSVYSKEHLLEIVSVVEKYRVPIISDEVYMDMVYKDQEYHPIGSLSEIVPVLSCCSVSKIYLVPGWRVGWIATYNRNNSLTEEIKPGIARLLMKVTAVPSTMLQAAIPSVLKNVPNSYIKKTMEIFESSASVCYVKLKDIQGLTPIMPTGAMYIMIKISKEHFPEFKNDIDFMKQLLLEQGVMGFPGSIFQYPWSMRLSLILPMNRIAEACDRLAQFCDDHYKP